MSARDRREGMDRPVGASRRAAALQACASSCRLVRRAIYAPAGCFTGRRFARRAGAICALLALYTLAVPCAVAQANAALEEGKRLAFELEFEPALAAFERALASQSLTRAELVELLAERALLWYALQRQSELVDDLTWLSALAPEYRLDSRAPPALVATWDSLRGQGLGVVGVELDAQRAASRFDARATLTGTVPKHARARIVWRRRGGAWRSVERSELHEPASEGEKIELYAEAIGPGELVVARSHPPDAPLRLDVSATVAGAPLAPSAADRAPQPTAPESWLRRHQVWLLGGAALVVVAAVVAVAIAVPRAPGDDERATNLKPVVSF